jgi:hypothetical protein
MEPYLTTQGAASVRRFHMWIRHYTEAEKTALRGQLAPGTDAVPVVKVSGLIELPMLTARKDARNLADVVKGMAATMTGQSPGALAGVRFTAREPQLFDEEEDHSSLYRLRWFHELVRSQPCAPYINFAPLPLSH